jgi:hypothetical protein
MWNCFKRLLDWLNGNNMPESQDSLIRDLNTIGILPAE